MRKYIIPLLLAVSSVAACQKTVKDEGKDINLEGYTMFNVDIEAVDLDGGAASQAVWADGASIGIFGSESGSNACFNIKRSDAGLSAASFYGELVKGSQIAAYAPYENGLSRENGAIPLDLAAVQPFESDASVASHFISLCPRIFASLGKDKALHFAYPLGLLNVSITFDEAIEVQGMKLSSNSKGLSGRMGVLPSGETATTSVSRSEISLDFGGTAVSSKDADGGFTSFLFVLPPAEYAAGELSLEITTAEELIRVQLPAIEVKRVEGKDFVIANTEVGSGLPGFETQPGILE